MKRGEKHSEATKRAMSESHKMTEAQRTAKDRDALRLMGPVKTWEFAERVGCSEKMAVYRLRRLYDAGLATRESDRRSRGYTYTAAA